jgi:fermentation-respiration switch protein FrsA (DUF1100 family)
VRLAAWAGLGLVLGTAAAAWLAGSVLIRVQPRDVALAPALGASPVALATPDGHPVAASFIDGAGRGAVLLLHGIGGDRRDMAARAAWLHARGYAVLLIDLPGQGASPAASVTFGLNEAQGVSAALGWLRRRLPGQRIGVVGVSLGGAATLLCRDCASLDAVVLESVYPTIEEAVENRLRMRLSRLGVPLARLLLLQLPLRLGIAPQELHPIARVGGLRVPVLIAAGAADRHTTLPETLRLYAAAPAPKELWVVDGAGHVNLHAFAPAEYERRIGAFLDRYVGRMP